DRRSAMQGVLSQDLRCDSIRPRTRNRAYIASGGCIMDNMPDNEANQQPLTNEQLESQYPGIEFAYPIAVNSYEVALKRLDSIDGRLQTMLAFIVAVSAVVPAVAVPRGIHFHAKMFYIALGIF